MMEIESFNKYEIMKIDRQEDLEALSDSSVLVAEMVNYLRSKKGGFGKGTERYIRGDRETNRTYYFNDDGKLFAIREEIKGSNTSTSYT